MIQPIQFKNHYHIIILLIAFLTLLTLNSCRQHCTYKTGETPSEAKVGKYLNHIRNNTAELTAFFNEMPKGGDLHNHLTGSVYAETYIDFVIAKNYAVNTYTLEVKEKPFDRKDWKTFSELQAAGLLDQYKEKLLQKWSVKDYNGVSFPSDKQFFETFPSFSVATQGEDRTDTFIMELKRRAVAEHVSYIELMTVEHAKGVREIDTAYNSKIEKARLNNDTAILWRLMDTMYAYLNADVAHYTDTFCPKYARHHLQMHIDDSNFTMRYLFCVVRVLPPATVFKNMMVAFACAADSNALPDIQHQKEVGSMPNIIVGVNILAPEDNEVSMRDYWLHMQMFKYLHNKAHLSHVKCSLHAGELALGMVKPEDMTWHIRDAVYTAGARRIGHGVDIPYERHCYDLLRYMAQNKIAVEINLSSNEFILHVAGDKHPISLYRQFNVPVVIATDDAGVLRTNMIAQYVLLASRYKNVSYKDIKTMVYNAITYSFIRETEVSKRLTEKLDQDFAKFEQEIIKLNYSK